MNFRACSRGPALRAREDARAPVIVRHWPHVVNPYHRQKFLRSFFLKSAIRSRYVVAVSFAFCQYPVNPVKPVYLS